MLNIIQGEDKTFTVLFRKEDGRPFDLTGATEIKLCFPGTTAVQEISLTGTEISVVNALLGEISATINDTKSALLKVGEQQTFEAVIDKGADRSKVKFTELLTVQSSIC